MNANGKVVHKVVKEVGSGLNDNRKKLNDVLCDDRVTAIYVEHADRLTRFGLRYIELICQYRNIELVIINHATDKENDIMQDFISIVTSFCSRIYGLRRTQRKTQQILEVLNDNKQL